MARLVIVSGDLRGREFVLGEDQTIGRLSENEIPVPEATISRRHARLRRTPTGWLLEDAGSSTGIRADEGPVERLVLEDGMRFFLGATEFLFMGEGEELVARSGEIPHRAAPAAAPRTPSRPDTGAARTGEFGHEAIQVRRSGVQQVTDKRLQFSENVGKKPGLLGGDLAQDSGLGRWLTIIFVIAFAGGLFWLTQYLVAGG